MNNFKILPQLVARAKAGEEQAFAELYAFFSKPVYYNARKLVGSDEDAMDILQEVMIRLYRHLDEIRDAKSLPLYLYRTTYHLSLNWLRKNAKGDLSIDNEDTPNLVWEKRAEFLPEDYIEDREKRELLLHGLEQLKPNQRALLLMYYYDGLSQKEIATILETNTNTVRLRIQRSREALKQQLEPASEKKGVTLHAMSLPVLTRVLHQNADALFTEEMNLHGWKQVAESLGLSAAAVTGAAGIAAGAGFGATVATGSAIGTKVAVALLTTGTVTAALIGTGHLLQESGSIHLPGENQQETVISSGVSPGVDIDAPNTPLSRIPLLFGASDTPDPFIQVPHTPQDAAEAPASAEGSGFWFEEPGESSKAGSPIPAPIQSTSDTLIYPKGTILTPEQLFHDAGITGATLDELSVIGFDIIDTTRPNQYGVLFIAQNTARQEDYGLAIIVVIEEQ